MLINSMADTDQSTVDYNKAPADHRKNPLDFGSIADFFALFAYKSPRQTASNSSSHSSYLKPSPIQNPSASSPAKRRNKPPLKSSSLFKPSSYIRLVVDGEKRVVSSYFSLPENASQATVIDLREVERRRLKWKKGERKLDLYGKKEKVNKQEKKKEEKEENKKSTKRRKQRSMLSAEERLLDAYRRVGEESAWEAPKSEYNLLQEPHCFDPWRVLVICMLLNMTTGHQVKNVLPGLFLHCPNAEAATKIPEEELAQLIKPLGLHKKRAATIIRFSYEYLGSNWTHVTQLHGVGKYAADAYAIFCAGKPEEVIPEDHKLVDYWNFVCKKRAQEQ